MKVKLEDLSRGEHIAGLRAGELDLALLGNSGALIAREFFIRRLATLRVFVALSDGHALAEQKDVTLADLRRELFVSAPENDMPGYNK